MESIQTLLKKQTYSLESAVSSYLTTEEEFLSNFSKFANNGNILDKLEILSQLIWRKIIVHLVIPSSSDNWFYNSLGDSTIRFSTL